MSKLQPNFSWQKYEGRPEDRAEQFQNQLQQQHIAAANAVNATIDDLSFWLRERPTGFTWVDGRQIFTYTFQALVSAFPLTHGIVGIKNFVRMGGVVQDTVPITTIAYDVPFVDPTTLANGIGLSATTTQINLVTTGGAYSTYTATITIEYTKR